MGGDVDSRSDVFSLGVVIYQMATGQLPFSGSTRAEMMDRILHAAPEPMMRLNPDLPSELERITLKCLDKRTDDRYQSARELLTDLWPLKRQLDANATRATPDSVRLERLRRSGSPASRRRRGQPAVADDARSPMRPVRRKHRSSSPAVGRICARGLSSRYPTLCRRFRPRR